MSVFKYLGHSQVTVAIIPASRKAQAKRIAARLVGRKCDVGVKVSKSRVLIKIYQ